MASSEMINILLSTNDNYMMPTMVLMESVLDTQTAPVSFYLLWSDLKECSRAALREFAEGRGSTITFLKIDGDAFADLPTKDYISRETYFRLLAADLLPKELDRNLWLDSDMIVRGHLDCMTWILKEPQSSPVRTGRQCAKSWISTAGISG